MRDRIDGEVTSVGGEAVLHFGPMTGRVRVGLVVPAVDKVVDLSVHPSAALACLDAAADRAGVPRPTAHRAARASLTAATDRAGAWRPRAPATLLAELGGAAFPTLGAAYDRGAEPIDEVPRWAVAILAASSARRAAEAGFAERTTRPVIAAVASALAGPDGGGPVGLHAVGLALIGAPVLDSDRLARVLAETAAHPAPAATFTVDELRASRAVVGALGAHRTVRVLTDASALPDGTRLLLDVVKVWPDVAPRLPSRLPNRLRELADVCRSLIVTDHRPPAPPPGRARAMPTPRLVRPGAVDARSGRAPRRAATGGEADPAPRRTGNGARADQTSGLTTAGANPPRSTSTPAAARRAGGPPSTPTRVGDIQQPPTARRARPGDGPVPPARPARAAPVVPQATLSVGDLTAAFDDPVLAEPHAGRRPLAHAAPAMAAPAAGGTVTAATPIPSTARVARIDGRELDGLRFARPRTCGDLERWGRLLRNCLEDFGPAAASGRSELVGVFRDDGLRGCLELTPDGVIRQLLGPANRRLDRPTERTVLRALIRHEVVDPTAAGNTRWFDPG
ncbi:hypothetical protein [Iamia sp.]|uniref:hypothetical protein n=1 Tax=Iamia sp. TaxID=2722710 RepID=UPI002B6AC087|nr:hypothetical protein [Iamia sp.]HXH57299.1 hypothetical protein [Iamia sp.]